MPAARFRQAPDAAEKSPDESQNSRSRGTSAVYQDVHAGSAFPPAGWNFDRQDLRNGRLAAGSDLQTVGRSRPNTELLPGLAQSVRPAGRGYQWYASRGPNSGVDGHDPCQEDGDSQVDRA
jgi:hypothetical protein